MKSLLFLISVFGCASALTGDAFFARYVNNFLNDSVSPCDNFYRHVCRREMPNHEKFDIHAEIIAEQWIQKGAKELERTRDYTKFEKILLSLGNVIEIDFAFLMITRNVTEDPVLSKGNEVAKLYRAMLERMQYLTAVPDVHMFAPRRLMHEIVEKAEKEINVSLLLTNRTLDRFREKLATLKSDVYDEYGSETYQEIFNNLDKFFHATGALETFNETNVRPDLKRFLRLVGTYGPGLLNLQPLAPTLENLRRRTLEVNAYYSKSDNSVHFFDPELILCINASIPARYGSVGNTMGHEMFHSILNSSRMASDLQLAQHTVCLANHMEEVCKVFSEGTCHSGALTYNEDSADMEAIQLLYKMMRDKLGGGLKNNFEGTNITNEQMFFYAHAMEFCEYEGLDGKINHPENDQYPSGWDVHSIGIPRVNGVPSLMSAFHEAFDCKAGDRMFDIAVSVCLFCRLIFYAWKLNKVKKSEATIIWSIFVVIGK